MSLTKLDLYETLEISKTATQQQIKQSYKKLALKYHPDKNEDKENAKIKFRQIAEAYAVLNDPSKRKHYDKYGMTEEELQNFNFEQFMGDMGDFEMFEEFLDQFLLFDTFQAMFSEMNKPRGKKNKTGRAKGRKKAKNGGGFQDLFNGKMNQKSQMQLFQAMMQEGAIDMEELNQLMMGMDLDQVDKQIQKMMLGSDSEDEQDLTEEELKILAFGQKNIEKKKVGNKKKKKKETKCKLCSQKIEPDQILMHFSENHMEQFKKSEKQEPMNSNGEKSKKEKKQQSKQQECQQFDY